MGRRRREPVQVVTDLREPLAVEHGRRIRIRLVAMVVWIAGWIVAGTQWQDGVLATMILLASGPGVWLLWFVFVPPRHAAGRRRPVTPPPPRALPRGTDPGRNDRP
ncbi:hypothetical protein H7X46_17475 [Pseudonocardia sp. C8]|uniref:hypothetical protein n=1 Tax=Pseudonocardia sp. C8 TaxID=2762759 RepID=UPI001642B525|nr:hypothetical protein [Pseudonocardia sp. C8]MBC3192850.1 hypothetical protein [Pseudonocardia sp. C8]